MRPRAKPGTVSPVAIPCWQGIAQGICKKARAMALFQTPKSQNPMPYQRVAVNSLLAREQGIAVAKQRILVSKRNWV
jgi:hypothetical protein